MLTSGQPAKRRLRMRTNRSSSSSTRIRPPLFAFGACCFRGGLEETLIEPLDVVVHRRAVALRLRGAVADAAEALVDDQLRGYVIVLQAVIQLERVGQRHALIRGAVLDQRRRFRLLDV